MARKGILTAIGDLGVFCANCCCGLLYGLLVAIRSERANCLEGRSIVAIDLGKGVCVRGPSSRD
jgi:hypothetical protein